VNIKIAGKWMFIPLKMVLIGIDPYPYKCSIWAFHPGKTVLNSKSRVREFRARNRRPQLPRGTSTGETQIPLVRFRWAGGAASLCTLAEWVHGGRIGV